MANLEDAFDFAMRFEGGGKVHTVEGDPGGTTKWGISKRANPYLDIPNLSRDDAIKVYRERYWNPRRLGDLKSQEIANEIFEFSINVDPAWENGGRATRAAQRTINEVFEAMDKPIVVPVDGRMGPETVGMLNYINAAGDLAVMAWSGTFNIRQLAYYRQLRRDLVDRFLLGWTRRVVE